MAFEMKTLVYVGLNGGNTHLQGKTAMVRIMPHSSHVLAQFDDTSSVYRTVEEAIGNCVSYVRDTTTTTTKTVNTENWTRK